MWFSGPNRTGYSDPILARAFNLGILLLRMMWIENSTPLTARLPKVKRALDLALIDIFRFWTPYNYALDTREKKILNMVLLNAFLVLK